MVLKNELKAGGANYLKQLKQNSKNANNVES
jgi:hypothetical protein